MKTAGPGLRARVSPTGLIATVLVRCGVSLLPLIELRLAQFTASDAALFLGLVAWLLTRSHFKEVRTAVLTWMCVGVLIGAILLVVAQYNAVDVSESISNALKLAFAMFVATSAVLFSIFESRDAIGLLWSFGIGSAIAAMSAVLGIGPRAAVEAGEVTRLVGLAGHPVGLAVSSGTAICVVFFLAARGGWALVKILVLIANGVGVAVAVGATGATVALSGLLLGMFATRDIKNAIVRIVGLLGLAATAACSLLLLGFGAELLTKLTTSVGPSAGVVMYSDGDIQGSTVEIRFLTWLASAARIADHPFAGNGLDDSGQIAVGNLATHNYILLAWQTAGVLGLGISAGLTLAGLLSILWLIRSRRSGVLSAPGVALLTATITSAMTGPALYGRGLYVLLAIGIGMAIYAHRSAVECRETLAGGLVVSHVPRGTVS